LRMFGIALDMPALRVTSPQDGTSRRWVDLHQVLSYALCVRKAFLAGARKSAMMNLGKR